MPTSDDSTLPLTMKINQVAFHLQLTPRTVYDLISRGELQSIKVGGSRRVTRQALLDYINR